MRRNKIATITNMMYSVQKSWDKAEESGALSEDNLKHMDEIFRLTEKQHTIYTEMIDIMYGMGVMPRIEADEIYETLGDKFYHFQEAPMAKRYILMRMFPVFTKLHLNYVRKREGVNTPDTQVE